MTLSKRRFKTQGPMSMKMPTTSKSRSPAMKPKLNSSNAWRLSSSRNYKRLRKLNVTLSVALSPQWLMPVSLSTCAELESSLSSRVVRMMASLSSEAKNCKGANQVKITLIKIEGNRT